MSGGLKVGDLFVLLSARTSSFGKSMESAAKLTENVAKRIKRAAQEIGRVGTLMAAGIGAALAVAAQHNAAVASEVQRSKDVFATFANEIASMMLPALREMNARLREVLGWWQSLSPEAKAQIAHWVELATMIGLGALALSKVAGIVSGLASAFGAVGSVLAAFNAPLMLVLAALVGIAVGVALLHRAWRTNWNGMQEKVGSFVEAISGYWQSFKDWLSTNFFGWFIDKWAAIEKVIARAKNFVSSHGGMTGDLGKMNASSDASINKWADEMKGGAAGAALKVAADKIKEGAAIVKDEWKLMAKEVGDALKRALHIKDGAPGKTISSAVETQVSNSQRLGEDGEQGQMFEFYKSADVVRENFGSSKKLGDDDEQGLTSSKAAESYLQEQVQYQKDLTSLNDAIIDAKEDEIAEQKRMAETFAKVRATLASVAASVTSKLGTLGQVINSAVAGFQSGGWIGAIVALVMELFSMWEGFDAILQIANGQVMKAVQDLASGFEGLTAGLRDFMGASGVMTDVIMQILNPILRIIGKVLSLLAPLIEVVAIALSGLVPIFELLDAILGPIFEAIGYVLRFVGLTILGTMNGLLLLWLGILGMIHRLVKLFGGDTKDIDKLYIDAAMKTAEIQTQMKNLFETGSTGLGDKALETAEALGKTAEAADKVTAALTNIPEGFKVALKQFNATQATSSSSDSQRERERQAFIYTGNTIDALPTSSGW